eukprot:CFRG6970T1
MCLSECIRHALLPGTRPEVKKAVSERVMARHGNVLNDLSGNISDPDTLRRWSPQWYIQYQGIDFVQVYFWLLKDWAWSQWHWYVPATLAGFIALMFSAMLISISVYHGAISMCWINIGAFLWLLGNFVWMIGEIPLENANDFFTSGVHGSVSEQAERFYDQMVSCAHYILLCGSAWLISYYILQFFHIVITMCWLLANMLWAVGELFINDDDVPAAVRESYSWPLNPTSDSRVLWRYAAGFFFMIAMIFVIIFHATWFILTKAGRLAQKEYHIIEMDLEELV